MTENKALDNIISMKAEIEYESSDTSQMKRIKCDSLNIAIRALKEIQQYQAIGTVDECREAMEKVKRKNPIILGNQSTYSEGKLYVAKYFKCPTCGNTSTYFGGLPNNCHNCGQSLESDIT